MAKIDLIGNVLLISDSQNNPIYSTKDANSLLSVSNNGYGVSISRKGVYSSESIHCGNMEQANKVMAAFGDALLRIQKQEQNTIAEKLGKAIEDLQENQTNADFIKEIICELQAVYDLIYKAE